MKSNGYELLEALLKLVLIVAICVALYYCCKYLYDNYLVEHINTIKELLNEFINLNI